MVLDRFSAFEWDAGVLRMEAGVGFSDVLEADGPHALFLPTNRGLRYVKLADAV
jgi:hypothetical protein